MLAGDGESLWRSLLSSTRLVGPTRRQRWQQHWRSRQPDRVRRRRARALNYSARMSSRYDWPITSAIKTAAGVTNVRHNVVYKEG